MTTDASCFDDLIHTCEASGVDAMLDALAASLAERKRWHALFDARIIQARVAVGLPPVGMPGDVPADRREAFDARSLAACREAGWPLLDGGQVAAGWMYLRAAVEPAEVAMLEDMPVIPLFCNNVHNLSTPKVRGFQQLPYSNYGDQFAGMDIG